jgi:hypothetical protein
MTKPRATLRLKPKRPPSLAPNDDPIAEMLDHQQAASPVIPSTQEQFSGLPEKTVQPADLLRTGAGHAATKAVKRPANIEGPCPTCGGARDRERRDGTLEPYCRKCHNAYQRRWQADQRKLLRKIKATGLNFSD